MIKLIILPGLMAISLAACQTTEKPAEVTAAEEALDKAQNADLDNDMPKAMELAQIRLSEAKDLLSQSDEALKDEDSKGAEELRAQAIAKAQEATAIVNSGLDIKGEMNAFDDGLVVKNDKGLATENRNLRSRIEQLQAQISREGLKEFGIAKPVAYFRTSSAEISELFTPEIERMASTLKEHPELYLTLDGFADPRGPTEFNQKLSEARAASVMQALIEQGIDPERIRMAGLGETGEKTRSVAELQLDRKVVAKFSTVAH